jgi:hypothetical protein
VRFAFFPMRENMERSHYPILFLSVLKCGEHYGDLHFTSGRYHQSLQRFTQREKKSSIQEKICRALGRCVFSETILTLHKYKCKLI